MSLESCASGRGKKRPQAAKLYSGRGKNGHRPRNTESRALGGVKTATGGPERTAFHIWDAPGAELSRRPFSVLLFRTLYTARSRFASRPLRSYTAIQRYTLYSYTSLYTTQAIQHPSARTLQLIKHGHSETVSIRNLVGNFGWIPSVSDKNETVRHR